MAKIILADIKGRHGFVNKDTIVGGFGARFKSFSITTFWLEWVRRFYQHIPSIQMAYLASIFRRADHEVLFTDGAILEGDVAIILSSIVDYKNERYWARKFRDKNKSARVGFIGPFAGYMPQIFESTADFIIRGEPEKACMDLAVNGNFEGIINSEEIMDLNILPMPDWSIFTFNTKHPAPGTMNVMHKVIPLVTSRSCPENCIYCPHRISGSYRLTDVPRVMEEIENNYKKLGKHYIIFRDSNFTRHRERVEEFIKELGQRKFNIDFEIETRLDSLDTELIKRLKSVGLKRITFGVESVTTETLKIYGRRNVEDEHQRKIINYCQKEAIQTQAFYIFGFPEDTVKSVIETIKYSLDLNTTLASYKVLTPFPGTLFYEQIKSSIFEKDWEKFDGLHLTFHHPNMSSRELRFLTEHAYARFYARPSQYYRYKGTYRMNRDFAELLDMWATKKHNELMVKSLVKEKLFNEEFKW